MKVHAFQVPHLRLCDCFIFGCVLWVMVEVCSAGVLQGAADSEAAFSQRVRGPGMSIPQPINRHELLFWLGIEEGPESRNDRVEAAIATYKNQIDTVVMPMLPPFWREVEAAGHLVNPSHEYAIALKSLYASRKKIIDTVKQADQVFFAEIETILGEPGLPVMEWAKLNRSRQVLNVSPAAFVIPRARPDLVVVIETIDLQHDLSENLRPVLLEYMKARLTQLGVIRQNSERDAIQGAELLADRARLATDDRRGHQLNDEERSAFLRRKRDAEQRMAATNEQYIKAIEAALEPEQVRRFRLGWLTQAYPKVYPHQRDPEIGIKFILDTPDLTDEQKLQFDALITELRAKITKINSELEEEHDRLGKMMLQELWVSSDTLPTHQQFVQGMLDTRDAIGNRFLLSMHGLLTPEQKSRLPRVTSEPRGTPGHQPQNPH